MTSRRNFVKKTVLVAAAMPVLQNELFALSAPTKKSGLALYTIRDMMQKDPAAGLAEAASAGYNWVEAADHSDGLFYKLKPKEFGKLVKKAGLELISTHSQIRPENDEAVVDQAAEAGVKYLILPSLPYEWSTSIDSYKKTAEYLNGFGEKCNKAGLRFGFHNHQIEFREINGEVPYQILLDNTDKKLVIFEIDLAWITAAGADPIAYFEKYPGRFEVWHMKDLTQEKEDATLGEGIIDFKLILDKYKMAGMKYWFIEQDMCRTHTPSESIMISRNYYINKLR